MRKFYIKILLKLLGDEIYQPGDIEIKKMQDWLFRCFKDDGFKHYYTMRKKQLVNMLSLGLEGKEQQRYIGRLEELKALQGNVNTEGKRKMENEMTKSG